jgi:hypothetical protein
MHGWTSYAMWYNVLVTDYYADERQTTNSLHAIREGIDKTELNYIYRRCI